MDYRNRKYTMQDVIKQDAREVEEFESGWQMIPADYRGKLIERRGRERTW